MRKFIKNLSLFVAGLTFVGLRPDAHSSPTSNADSTADADAVKLRPLNWEISNLFAAHRSHSSHSSHSSHRSHYSGSGGGGGGEADPTPAPTPAPPSGVAPTPGAATPEPQVNRLYDGGAEKIKPAPQASPIAAPALSNSEKLQLQIMRVQIRLARLGLYEGRFDGVLNSATTTALKHFQQLKKLPENGLMTTPTLNALGITPVN